MTDFAKALKLGLSTVSMWENGNVIPLKKNLIKISEVLGVPLGTVFESVAEGK